ncbi:MAG: GAF domain-containing protein, partial [Leptolyngbyaceae bacterium]|nr:GAF domain-containing protein [Leptolyngbyaceae bacterium]
RVVGVLMDVSERKRNEAERQQLQSLLHQRVEQEQALNRVVRAVRQSLDLSAIFATATAEITQLLQAERTTIGQYLPDHKCWQVLAEYPQNPNPPTTLGLETPESRNPAIVLSRQFQALEMIQADEINPEVGQRLPGTWLVIPINFNGTTLGILTIFMTQQDYPWAEEQVELAQALADQLAIAIHQSELYHQVQALNTDLECQVQERTAQLQQSLDFEALLKRITDKVRDSLDEEQILQTAVQELALTLGADSCDSGIYNADRTTSTVQYEYAPALAPAQGTEHPINGSPFPGIYQKLLQGEHCQFCFIGENLCRPSLKQATVLTCPIFDNQGVLGDLWLFRSSQPIFDSMEIRLVQQVANQCAIALRQSRLYQTSQSQVQELERLNQVKDDFLSTVSHELRSPMANIKMATQMLELQLTHTGILDIAEKSPIQRYFQILKEECQRETQLINDLLDLARLDANTEPLTLTLISLKLWIEQISSAFTGRIQQQQQQLKLEVPEDLDLETDASYLERLLTELLHNACKYTPAGETIILSAKRIPDLQPGSIPAQSLNPEAWLQLCVSNSGVEIPAVECDRIFDKFYRIPNNDPWKHGGTGLGLALVKKLTEHLGGRIRVESSCQQTTFILELRIFAS